MELKITPLQLQTLAGLNYGAKIYSKFKKKSLFAQASEQ